MVIEEPKTEVFVKLCSGDACKYHLKYVKIDNKYNIIQDNNKIILNSDNSITSEDVNIYKNICKNVITKKTLSNIRIFELSKSKTILKNNLNNFEKDINNYLFNLRCKKNILKSLIVFTILYNKTKIKREKKRIKNKRKKDKRKAKLFLSHNSHIPETSENSKNIPNGLLLKENNKYYTYNFYDEKVIANNIDGVICYYCNSIRYTSGWPCINPNCCNRSFSNIEFEIYYDKHGKHKESIYNPFFNNNKRE